MIPKFRFASLIKAVDEEFPRVVKTLNILTKEIDAKTSSKAKSLLISILDFDFLMGLQILKIICPNTSKLNSFVQSPSIDIRKVKMNAELTIKTLEGCRNDSDFDIVWDNVNLRCDQVKAFLESEKIDIDFKEPRLPRQLPENVSDMKGYQKVMSYFPSLDRINAELKNRFAENDKDHLCSLGALIFDSEVCDKDIEAVANYYFLDKDALSMYLRLYKHFKVKLKQKIFCAIIVYPFSHLMFLPAALHQKSSICFIQLVH